MAQRSLLCIEPDAATVAEIRKAFQPYGFRVESIPNGEQAIEWARTNEPSLIILAVEPRKVGYALCNKIKRSPALRDVPLILISSEETQATFDQHKKLKSRADVYRLKPLGIPELLSDADRLVGLAGTPAAEEEAGEEIELADDEIAEVSLDEDDAIIEDESTFSDLAPATTVEDPSSGAVPVASESLHRLGDLSRPMSLDPHAPSPFQEPTLAEPGLPGEAPFDEGQFDQETQAAFAALEAGAGEGGAVAAVPEEPVSEPTTTETLSVESLWDDEELPSKLPWEEPQAATATRTSPGSDYAAVDTGPDQEAVDSAMIFGGSASTFVAVEPRLAMRAPVAELSTPADEIEFSALGHDVPPLPEEVIYDDRLSVESARKDQTIAELTTQVETLAAERGGLSLRSSELQTRIESLEAERQTLRKELDEQRERMNHAASQGAFSKERDLLSLREVINKKEKDILDLRDALDAKERQILDHKDKIRENERARRDLEERTLGFEKSLVQANEKAAELFQDKEKSVERERGLKARLDDAHEELRKGQDEIEALRKRITQEIDRGRLEVEKTRIELEGKLAEAQETHHAELSKATDEWTATQQAQQAAYQAELSRSEAAHRTEVDGLQRRLADESAMAAERLQSELSKLRRDHDKTVASMKEEQAMQLASERQAYEMQTEAKQRTYREELMSLRRRHEEELAAAEDRRQRDIQEQEQRRVGETEQAENRRRAELQGRDEEHHGRVTEIERRHLMEKTETAERHRLEHDQAVGRAVRAEGELIARSQEIEQAYRRLAGFEADLDAARVELGDRDLKLTQQRDRLNELETKLSDYEDQIVRAYQRLRSDEKTGEKIRRALGVALALMDERSSTQVANLKATPASEEAEKS